MGSGRERVARALHSLSRRAAQPFVVMSCGGGWSGWLEAELLGVDVVGAAGKLGALEQAREGSLMLTDIEELPLDLQDAVLHLIEHHELKRMSTGAVRPAMARCLATTSVDLRARVAAGRFRKHLYDVLARHVVALPPLRDRLDDVPTLAQHLLDQGSAPRGDVPQVFTREAQELLCAYRWPGNLRELREVVRQTALTVGDRQIEAADLPARFIEEEATAPRASLRDVEMRHILRVLDGARGNQRLAARILGISRWSLARRLEKYGLRTHARLGRRRARAAS